MISILGCSAEEYGKKLNIKIAAIISLAVGVVILNILLAVFRTDVTHIAFMIINICSDVVAGWFIIGYSVIVLHTQRRILKLAEKEYAIETAGVVVKLNETSERYGGFECLSADLQTDDGIIRIYIVCVGAIKLSEGLNVNIKTVNNIVIYAEVIK